MNPIPYCSGANACVYTTRPRPTYKLARMKKHQTSRRDVSSRRIIATYEPKVSHPTRRERGRSFPRLDVTVCPVEKKIETGERGARVDADERSTKEYRDA